MATLYTQQSRNVRKTWLIMTAFLLIIIALGWSFSYIYNAPEILFIAVLFSVVMNIFSFWNSDKIVIKMTGAKEITRESHRELYNIVENLSITAGLPVPRIYIINDSVPNAFATGRDKEHSAVAVTTGLLNIMDRSELEGVIAHELAHIGNRDILVMTIVVVLVGFVTLLSDFFLRMSFFGGGDNRGDGRFQVIMVIAGFVLAILSPVVAMLIQLSISRKREFLADATGALLTRYPEGLASALEKLESHSGKMKKANHATAHLFIASPFGRKSNKGWNKWFMTHPPVSERIEALRTMG